MRFEIQARRTGRGEATANTLPTVVQPLIAHAHVQGQPIPSDSSGVEAGAYADVDDFGGGGSGPRSFEYIRAPLANGQDQVVCVRQSGTVARSPIAGAGTGGTPRRADRELPTAENAGLAVRLRVAQMNNTNNSRSRSDILDAGDGSVDGDSGGRSGS